MERGGGSRVEGAVGGGAMGWKEKRRPPVHERDLDDEQVAARGALRRCQSAIAGAFTAWRHRQLDASRGPRARARVWVAFVDGVRWCGRPVHSRV